LKTDQIAEAENEYPRKSALRENIEAILVAIVIALFIRTFVVQAFKIPSGSMKQTLQIGDHILVNKFIYGLKIPYLRKTIIPMKGSSMITASIRIRVFFRPISGREIISDPSPCRSIPCS
jgi:signal peptidase I